MKSGILAALLAFGLSASAKVNPVWHYNFGKAGNVTYASAPEQISPSVGKGALAAVGNPVFYADAPGDKKLRGEGGILFDGKDDGYRLGQALGSASENYVLEVWVKPRLNTTEGRIEVVVSNGNGKNGYVIVQKNDQWIAISGGQMTVEIGEAVKGVWTHLALVLDEGKGTVWQDGKQTGTFRPTKELSPNFSIALSDKGDEAFYGEIYEVRYSTFKSGKFDPSADFLLDYKELKRQTQADLERRKAVVAQIQAPGLGKESVSEFSQARQAADWLIQPVTEPCRMQVKKSADEQSVMFQIGNGLVARTFYVGANLACVGYKNLSNEAEYLRAVKPEARIRVDSIWYEVGGLKKQPEYSYLLESWYAEMENSRQAFTLTKVETDKPIKRYPWQPQFNAVKTDWPAKGLRVVMTYEPTENMQEVKDLTVKVNYEIYEGLPVMTKWVEIENNGKPVVLNEIETEIIAVNQDQTKRLHVESDYSFALANADIQGSALMHYAGTPKKYHVGSSTTNWRVDPEYNTWASHNQAEDKFLGFQHNNLLVSTLPMGQV